MLFNKRGTGSQELYEISGTFEAKTDYHSVDSEVQNAMNVVASFVGHGVISAAETIYASEAPSSDEEAFLAAVRKPVAYLAISMHARLSGLSHGDTGRKIKVDDNEKIPFEWMVDRDNLEMRERFFRAMSGLFSFLEGETVPSDALSAWHDSDAYKMAQSSVVRTAREFDAVYPIDGSAYMFYKMLPLIIEVQPRLRALIGDEKMEQLLAGSEASAPYAALAVRYVVLESMVRAVERWSVSVFPIEVARRFSPTYQGNRASSAATVTEVDWYLNKLKLQIKDVVLELKTTVSGNPYNGMELIPANDPRKKYFTT